MKHPLSISNGSFACCGATAVCGFFAENGSYFATYEEALTKLKDLEYRVHKTNRMNMAVAVLNGQENEHWRDALMERGWQQIGNVVTNSKTGNPLYLWQCDFTKQVLLKHKTPIPPVPATLTNSFNAQGANLDRRDEARMEDGRVNQVGPRSSVSEGWATQVKDRFLDINDRMVLTVDLPVFNRGPRAAVDLKFYSIRLANGESYSWLQGGNHRFPG